jgi:ATPase family associated with various cellular activities (AAA)
MNAPLPQAEAWLLANQQALAAAFARLKALLAGRDAAAVEAPAAEGDTAIDRLAAVFELSSFERELLLLAAGVEMDAELAAAVAQARGRRPGLSFGLALGLFTPLGSAHWSALAPHAPLRRWRLLELDDSAGLTAGRVRIDERILHALAGVAGCDTRLATLTRALPPPAAMAPTQAQQAAALAHTLRGAGPGTVLLAGDDADGQADVAAATCAALGLSTRALVPHDLPEAAAEQQALALLWQREAALSGVALALRCSGGAADTPRLQRWLALLQEGAPCLVFVCASEPPPLPHALLLHIHKPAPAEQRLLWQQALRCDEHDPLPGRLAAQFRLSAREIAERAFHDHGADGADDAGRPAAAAALWQHCRQAARPRLEALAQRVSSSAGWADLVLPEPALHTLRLMAAQLQHRHTVHTTWGFAERTSRGLGLSALFFGDSGVGKTLACEVLAHELALDLYRIDLSAVVSKYIGETEKNLRAVFDGAEDTGAILLFDEADALFGKRSEVKDSHDRYANIEVGYLLQRMEAYRGLAVLTTNQRRALDPAFLRRLRFVVNFPFPDQAQRERIWRCSLPPALPRGDIDFAKLARLPLAGGAIRNIVLNAAFFAAAEGAPLQMAHLAQAAQLEAAKQERPGGDSQTRGWA